MEVIPVFRKIPMKNLYRTLMTCNGPTYLLGRFLIVVAADISPWLPILRGYAFGLYSAPKCCGPGGIIRDDSMVVFGTDLCVPWILRCQSVWRRLELLPYSRWCTPPTCRLFLQLCLPYNSLPGVCYHEQFMNENEGIWLLTGCVILCKIWLYT